MLVVRMLDGDYIAFFLVLFWQLFSRFELSQNKFKEYKSLQNYKFS